MNILVTGAKGQMGSELKELEDSYPFTFIFTDIEELDITNQHDIQELVEKENIECIINFAAYTAVDKAEEEPIIAEKLNCEAVQHLKNVAKKNSCYLIHISTDYVFDGKHYLPYKEDDNVNPDSSYGRSKLKGEQVLADFNKAMIIRTSWLYSSYGNNFVKTIIRLGKERDSIGVIFDQVGSPTYAADLALSILDILKKVSSGEMKFISGIYHFSNEGVCSWYDFAKVIIEFSELECDIVPIETKDYPLPAKRPQYSVLNKSKIKKAYKVKIPYWKDSLRICIENLQ